jgi:hypothetical protein
MAGLAARLANPGTAFIPGTTDPPSAPVSGQPRGDAVQHDVEAELEAFRAGGRVVRVDVRVHEPREPRVPPGGVDALREVLLERLYLRLGERRGERGHLPLGLDLRDLAQPMQHPELAVVAWSVLLIAVFAPLAVRLYRRKSVAWPIAWPGKTRLKAWAARDWAERGAWVI